jgi:radical SAM/Cys-rich protein
MSSFDEKVKSVRGGPLVAKEVAILQVNLGYACNMSCKHCHLSAGPGRKEMMSRETIEAVLGVLRRERIGTLDITGGAPELHPELRNLVREARRIGTRVIVRTNLTVLEEPACRDLPEFFRDHRVDVIASMPGDTGASVSLVRGRGAFSRSLKVLRILNDRGYGTNGLQLHLVYNPPGAALAPLQKDIELEFRKTLRSRHGIAFNSLYVFPNMALGRFRDFLLRTAQLDSYMSMVREAFNPATLEGLMCRDLVSVRWDGALFDCDYNQALDLFVDSTCPRHIAGFDIGRLSRRNIVTGEHCFVCAAGQGGT